MFSKIAKVVVGLLFLYSTRITAQEDFLINGLRDNKIKFAKFLDNKNVKRNKIDYNFNSNTGEWKVFKNWNEDRAVFAESDSIVWVGTSVGLIRWNVAKETYQTFDESNGLKFTWINALVMDKTGNLWIAAKQGLAVYSNGEFIHYNHLNSPLPESSIDVICVDSMNRIFVAFGPPLSGGWAYEGGIARFDGSYWQLWQSGSSIYRGPTFSMSAYNDTIWIGGGETLYIIANELIEKAPDWNYGGVYSIAIDYQDSLWIEAFSRKTLKYTSNGWQVIIDRNLEGIGDEWYDIWNDPRGGLWLSMKDIWWSGYGPYRLDFKLRNQGSYCETGVPGICTVPGIPGQFYAHHALSATSQFFVSLGSGTTYPEYKTTQGGLFFFNGVQWKVFRIPTTILQNEIYALGSSQKGDVFLSYPFYSQKTDGKNWQTIGEWVTGMRSWNTDFRIAPDESLFANHHQIYPNKDSYSGYVTGLDFDGFGNLWTSYGNILRFNWPGLSIKNFADETKEITQPYQTQYMDISVDKYDKIWAGSWYYGGIMYDRTSWHPFPPTDSTLPNGNYDLVFADSKDRIWFATNQWSPNYGFTIYEKGVWSTYYSPQKYSISYIYQIAEDNFGNIWLATGGGIIKYDGTDFILYDSKNSPLSTDYVSGIAADVRGNIWIGTKAGIYVFNPGGEVELGPYTYSSPVDSMAIKALGKVANMKFKPSFTTKLPVTYQLQRGRGTHKFWTVTESDSYINVPETIELNDQSPLIGKYVYRIRAVSPDGKVRYSPVVEFVGGVPEVKLSSFNHLFSGSNLYFIWETSNQAFVNHFEIWCSDSTAGQSYLLKIIQPDTSDSQMKQYEILADKLEFDSHFKKYILKAVFSDSSKSELKSVYIKPSLPEIFLVSKNYPNPFNSSTTFEINIPARGTIKMKIYDILGNEMQSSEESYDEGFHRITRNFSTFASGVYLYSIEGFGKFVNGKFVVLK